MCFRKFKIKVKIIWRKGTGRYTRGRKTAKGKETVEQGHPEGVSGPHNSRYHTDVKYQSRLPFIHYRSMSPSIPDFYGGTVRLERMLGCIRQFIVISVSACECMHIQISLPLPPPLFPMSKYICTYLCMHHQFSHSFCKEQFPI